MRKNKKPFTYETETLNIKELEEDLKQAEQLIAKLKDQVDPKAEKLKRRRERVSNLLDSLFLIAVIICYSIGFILGHKAGFEQVESIYDYSALVGIVSDTE